jgi:hypothetical protein
MAANMWENNLKNLECDNNRILYETLLDFFTALRSFWEEALNMSSDRLLGDDDVSINTSKQLIP